MILIVKLSKVKSQNTKILKYFCISTFDSFTINMFKNMRLTRCMATQNSSALSEPVLVMSARPQMCPSVCKGSPDLVNSALAISPEVIRMVDISHSPCLQIELEIQF